MSVIEPGAQVSEFKLAREDGSSFTEQDLLGQYTVFVFYPFAFSPVCTDQLQLYERELGEITAGGGRPASAGRDGNDGPCGGCAGDR